MLLALLFGWIIFSYLFAAVAPPLVRGIGELIAFLFICLGEVFKLALRAFAWALRQAGKCLGMGGGSERTRRVRRLGGSHCVRTIRRYQTALLSPQGDATFARRRRGHPISGQSVSRCSAYI